MCSNIVNKNVDPFSNYSLARTQLSRTFDGVIPLHRSLAILNNPNFLLGLMKVRDSGTPLFIVYISYSILSFEYILKMYLNFFFNLILFLESHLINQRRIYRKLQRLQMISTYQFMSMASYKKNILIATKDKSP